MKAKLPLIIVIVVVVALVVVAVILGNPKKEGTLETEGPSLENVEIAAEIYGFSAEIKGIKDKILSLEGSIPAAEESAQPIKGMVKGVVTEQTKIVKLKFPETPPADKTEPVYPEETEMNFDELKVGDKIDIGAVGNISENIKNGTDFELNHIFIIE